MSIRSFLTVAGALALLIADASGQVNYVRELIGTTGVGTSSANAVLTSTQAPGASAAQAFLTVDAYHVADGATGVVERGEYPLIAQRSIESIAAFAGSGTPFPPVTFLGAGNEIYTLEADGDITYAPAPLISIQPTFYRSFALAAPDASVISLIADAKHYTVDLSNGVAIQTTLMSTLDASAAFYQSYGPDGNLYVLDYANHRMASFAPDTFAPLGSFDLNTTPGITTANQQFAIGINGSFYLADGLGGGTYYNSAGTYQGAFFTPEGVAGDSYIGASYVSTDSSGRVYVYDSATGFHQFQDLAISSIPEPTTYAIGIATLLCGLILVRRRPATV